MARVNYRKKPSPVKAAKAKPKAEKPTEVSKGRKFAKALKGLASEGAQEAAQDTTDASVAELTNVRLANQRSTPGKAQSIIKNRRV